MSLTIADVQMVEIGHASLTNGREQFNELLDECYDDDSVARLCVFFDKNRDDSKSLENTFKTMDFERISTGRLEKNLSCKFSGKNCYLIIDTNIATSDEDFESCDLIDFD